MIPISSLTFSSLTRQNFHSLSFAFLVFNNNPDLFFAIIYPISFRRRMRMRERSWKSPACTIIAIIFLSFPIGETQVNGLTRFPLPFQSLLLKYFFSRFFRSPIWNESTPGLPTSAKAFWLKKFEIASFQSNYFEYIHFFFPKELERRVLQEMSKMYFSLLLSVFLFLSLFLSLLDIFMQSNSQYFDNSILLQDFFYCLDSLLISLPFIVVLSKLQLLQRSLFWSTKKLKRHLFWANVTKAIWIFKMNPSKVSRMSSIQVRHFLRRLRERKRRRKVSRRDGTVERSWSWVHHTQSIPEVLKRRI